MKKDKEIAPRRKPLEDYEPGATREEVLAGLRKAINTPKTSKRPDSASSKT
jgi:hypothetical protein